MYKIDQKYGNLNKKIYIDSNFEHLLASNLSDPGACHLAERNNGKGQ